MLDRVSRVAETDSEPESDDMQFREHPAVQGKRDFYPVDPRKLKIDVDYNVRDMNAPDVKAHVAWLKASITAPEGGGVHVPLEVRLDGKSIYVTAGHCRLAAVMEAIAEGHEIETVPCIPEAKGTNEIDRIVNLVVSNSGKPLAPLEVAAVVKRLVTFGWAEKKIAERLGWKSAATVKQHLDMLAMPEPVKEHVRAGEISATLARNIVKGADPDEAEKLIKANLEENKRIKGKKSTKVTAKTIKRDRPKPQAPADEEAMAVYGSHETEGGIRTHRPTPSLPPVHEPAASVELPPASVAQAAAPAPMIPNELHETTRASVEEFHNWTPDAPTPAASNGSKPNGVKDLIEALKPFADLGNDNDLNAKSDDDLMEVFVRDVKQAWKVYTAATGGNV